MFSVMPRRSIATFDRVRIVPLCQEGLSSREVSRTSQNEQKRCCSDIGRYRDTETVDDMRRSGRPKATTAVDDRYLRNMLNNTFRAAIGSRVSTQTVRNRLYDAQLGSRRP